MTSRDHGNLPEGGAPHGPGDSGAPVVGRSDKPEASLFARILLSIIVLAVGVFALMAMIKLKEPPSEAKIVERALPVNVQNVSPEDVPVTVVGLGDVRALNTVPISPEVAGVVVALHPNLELGGRVARSELLFQIDPTDYRAALDQARAQVGQFEKTVERLTRQAGIDRDRLRTLDRNEALMREEFQRVKDLFEKEDVGTRSAVDRAEVTQNQAADARDQLAQAVDLYPVQIEEAKSALQAARAQLTLAEANLARTEVRANFDARVSQVAIELGQYVNPGRDVLTLADDSVLEISVSLDSRDARNWLQIDGTPEGDGVSWFGALQPVRCTVAWTEDPEAHRWQGTAHRIESFDPQTRTLRVAVRVTAQEARTSTGGLPLVEGMFCEVGLPGRVLRQVYRLPRWAVTYEGNVFLARGDRLEIRRVEVARTEGDVTYVTGLQPGDAVITTRLVDPLPNALLEPTVEEAAAS